ncbi:hypothetical protein C0991_009120 [Blastosporella zonata]|nr:hypothetical protein C0991_009120 [Blastosporella zonata]
MSFQAAVDKLNSPVKDLVVAFTENGTRHVGDAEKDQAEVVDWIEKAAQPDVASEANIQTLNNTLVPRTYLVNNNLTAADVAIYGALHPYISKLQPPQYYVVPSLTRFFDHIQSSPSVRPFGAAFSTVNFDIENAPTPERKAEPPKKKEKKSASATPAPEAEKVQIDIGEETGPRTVVSGLVHYIPIEEMRDKVLIAVCNLKPANMRGVKSFAMVLCATSKDGKEAGIELIQPPANAKPGDRVYFEGSEYENGTPLSQLNPKKKIFEAIQPGFITLDSKEAAWVNPATKSVHKIRTKDGVCVAPTLVGASLS